MPVVSIVIIVLALAALPGVAWLRRRLAHPADRHGLQSAMDDEVAKFAKRMPDLGLVIGVLKDGEAYTKGYGRVRADGSGGAEAPDETTVFQIGSVSKVFTAALLQILCDEGRLSMDATLRELLGDSMPLSPAVQQVTLRQLVTHTSGFPSIPPSLLAWMTAAAKGNDLMLDPYGPLGADQIFEHLSVADGKKKPGRFEYSNYGMGLLGHLLEKLTDQNYESLLREKMLAPLGMDHTGVQMSESMQAALAQGHTGKGSPTPIWRFGALSGAGALSSNVHDMLKFMQANLNEGDLLWKPFAKMREPQFNGDSGIGWIQPSLLDRLLGNQTMVWHNGMVGGYASYLAIDAKTKSGVVILANTAVSLDMLGMMLMRQVRTQSWSAGLLAERMPVHSSGGTA
ncbi:serine hydrolase [Hydrogenophaga sp. 5NK40-0174]|uniref:serine hydrolase domain-containing protein n=1 Tax=Hydrogenophaga sp. 5NK40-0174 TaxID=3127649 RepID=UPI0031043287